MKNVAYEDRLDELRRETLAFEKQALKVVSGNNLETVFMGNGLKTDFLENELENERGDKIESPDANSVRFTNSVRDMDKYDGKVEMYKREFTRAFCFSYFDFLRKTDTLR